MSEFDARLSNRLTPRRRQSKLFVDWYNQHRPHAALRGRTPDEAYHRLRPAHRRPRAEPRPDWPRSSRCAAPQTLVAGAPGARIELHIEFIRGEHSLPVVTLRRVA